ncbi:MAG: helix-turn-helix domain-containing protein [Mangrovibacterium sp.]
MNTEKIGQSIFFYLKNVSFLRFSADSEYNNIISPFTRIYVVTEGEGQLILKNEKIGLTGGFMYLIPSFTSCSYHFNKNLAHFYIHFSMEIPSGLTPYHLYSVSSQVQATALDTTLFQRCIELNPGYELPHHNPLVYQKEPWINRSLNYNSMSHFLETEGIMKLLFSRFVGRELTNDMGKLSSHNIQSILKYIQENMEQEIEVNRLAEMTCISKDHFTRVFKSVTGVPPSEFIILKRIEKAKLLLLTTDNSLGEICSQTGFNTTAYFCRLFKKYTNLTPVGYRKHRG